MKKITDSPEKWDTAIPDPTMVELYNGYRIRVKAKYPTPEFHEWLLRKALQLFYEDTDLKFDDNTKLSILYDLDLPTVSPYRKHLLKKTARQTLTQIDIKNGARLYQKNIKFRQEIEDKVDSMLLHYMKTNIVE